MNRVRLRNRFLKSRSFEDKRLTIKRGTTECHLSGKLRWISITTLIIRSLLATNPFGNT